MNIKYYYISNPDGTFYKGQFLTAEMAAEYTAKGYAVKLYDRYM